MQSQAGICFFVSFLFVSRSLCVCVCFSLSLSTGSVSLASLARYCLSFPTFLYPFRVILKKPFKIMHLQMIYAIEMIVNNLCNCNNSCFCGFFVA